ncbi:MAG: hypothetical protein WBP81_06435, partial [Solirubrobacteraceae bacterium]
MHLSSTVNIADEDRRRGRVQRTSLWFLLCSTHPPTPQQRRRALRAIATRTMSPACAAASRLG